MLTDQLGVKKETDPFAEIPSEVAPSEFDVNQLPGNEFDALYPSENPDDEMLEVAGLGMFSKPISRILSPRKDVFGKSAKKLDELRAAEEARKSGEPTISEQVDSIEPQITGNPEAEQAAGAVENVVDAQTNPNPEPAVSQPKEPTDDGFDADYDTRLQEMDAPYDNGSVVREDGDKAEAVMQGLKKPAVPNPDGMLTDFRAVGAQGDAKIPDEGNVLSVVETISKEYSTQINEQTRGQVTLEATRQVADLVGTTPNRLASLILGRQRGGVIIDEAGGAGLAETMLAARDLLITESKKLDILAKRAENGTAEDALAFRQQLEFVAQLQSQVKGAQTEIARALGSFRVPARGADDAELAMRDTATLLDEYGGAEDIRDLARMYNQGGSRANRLELVRGASKLKKGMNAIYEVWMMGLLSSPITHSKNIIGTTLAVFNHGLETLGQAGVGTVRRVVSGQPGGAYFGEFNAEVFGITMAMKDAWSAAGKAFIHGEQPFPGSKIQGMQGQRPVKAFSAEGLGLQGPFGTLADVLGTFLTMGRIPARALEFEDAFFKTVAHRQYLYQQAYRTGMTKGLRGDALADHIANYIFDPPMAAIEKAEAHGKYVTLQTQMDEIGRSFNRIRKVPMMRFFVPFLNSPYNGFKYSYLDRTPLGVFWGESANTLRRGKAPGASRADKTDADLARVRIAMGSMAMMSVAFWASTGAVTGAGPADMGYRAALRRSGWQPYSIKIGDTYYSIAGGEPISSTIMLAADISELLMSGVIDGDTGDELIAAGTAALANQLTQKTFMQGFAALNATLNDPVRYANQTADGFVSSVVPRITALAEKTVDPIVRDARTRVERIQAQVPGWSVRLPMRRNLWGQKIMFGGAYGPDVLSPVYTSTYGPNETVEAPGVEGFDTSNYAKRTFAMDQEFIALRFGPNPHPDQITKDIGLTSKEKERYHEYCGIRSLQALEEAVTRDDYQNWKQSWIKDGSQIAREAAQDVLKGAVLAARGRALRDLMDDEVFGQAVRDRIKAFQNLMTEQAEQYREALQ